jgi:alanyl-tRNA synthetase
MDIREKFLKYFESYGHKVVPSAPLVPDDPTLLFTNAGMVPFKRIFTGEVPLPKPPRATSSQTCMRAGGKHNDLENVGYTNRHHTFFEMLGNFSFGDYFKAEAIAYAWEFITKVLELPEKKLWVTVHKSDEEAEKIWKKFTKTDRILRFGDKDNFWQMGDTGPCGPCSEIFYDQGAEHFNSFEDKLGGEGDRFLEIWNLVFMQYEKDESGKLHPLPKPSIDTGMGLERVIAIKEGVFSNYDSSLFMPLINKVSELTGKEYVYEKGASFRVIADHIRSVTFLLAQGVNFDREGRGYVLRRILRRAVRHGYLLGVKEPFMYKLVNTLNTIMKKQYPYLEDKKELVKELILLEEERFFNTLESGLELFNKELKKTKDIFSGKVAFKLYDTYGFPLDLTEDMLKEKGIKVDRKTFDTLMNEQKAKAKASWKGSGDSSHEGNFRHILERFVKNEFIGYDTLTSRSKILTLLNENFEEVESLSSGDIGWVLLDKTPFYATGGGQIGDIGELENKAKVIETKKFFELNLSKIEVTDIIKKYDIVKAIVDNSRGEVSKHHSATHLLHSALKKVLGNMVNQAGSLVEKDRLRFDFSYPKALSANEITEVEDMVNSWIERGSKVDTNLMSIDEAKKSAATALFGEKYGQEVRVVTMGEFSKELCGGTHIDDIGKIGLFVITKESGVSAGVRRIEAVCSNSARELFKKNRGILEGAKTELKAKDLLQGIKKIKDEIKILKREIKTLQSSTKKELNFDEIDGVKVCVEKVESGDIKTLIDEAKAKYEKVAIMLFQPKGDKVMIACGSKGTSVKAGIWIKTIAPLLGGGGGGRDDFAQAGGKDIFKIDEAIKESKNYLEENL